MTRPLPPPPQRDRTSPPGWQRFLGPAVALGVVSVAVLAPLTWWWAAGRTLAWFDTASLFAPMRSVVGDALRSGRLPLWVPSLAGGVPLFADPVHGVLHPFSVAAAFLSRRDGVDPLIGLHVWSAAVGATVLARSLGATWTGAATSGIAYGLSGFTLSMAGNLVFLAGAGALPWTLAGLRATGARATPAAFALAAAAVGCNALCGDLQALAVGTALGLALGAEAGGPRGALRVAAAAACGALVAGVQLVPSWAFLQQTTRAAGLTPVDLAQWSFSPWRLLELIAPGFFIHPADGYSAPVFTALVPDTPTGLTFAASVYLGAPVLCLAALGARATRAALLLAAACALLGWLALGPLLGAQQLSQLLPSVRGFRYSEKYVGPLGLCLAALAGLGADALLADRARARRLGRVAGAAAVATAAVFLLLRFVAAGARSANFAVAMEHLRAGLPHAALALAGLALCAGAVLYGFTRAARGGVVLVAWAGACAAAGFALRPGEPAARLAVPAPDLAAAPPGPRALVRSFSSARGRLPGWDFFDERAFAFAAAGGTTFNVQQGLDSLDFYGGFSPSRYASVVDAFGADWPRAARRYGLTHVLLPWQAPLEAPAIARMVDRGFRLADEPRTGAPVFAVPHRDWASFPARVEVVETAGAAVERLVQLHSAGDRAAVIEAPSPLQAGPGRVLGVARERERLAVEAESQGEAVLVVNDAFWPGWKATIDGRSVPIFPADGFVRAVPWPTGRHRLEMTYDPPELSVGLAASALGVAAVAFGCVLLRRRG